MNSPLIVANWKSNKTVAEALKWVEAFRATSIEFQGTLVLCVPFTVLAPMKAKIEELSLPIQLGAQDVSPFPSGAYTGAISARMLVGLAEWVLVGHPERRKHFHEPPIELERKVEEAKDAGLKVIYCLSEVDTVVPLGVDAVAYEPMASVGTGNAADPDRVSTVLETIKVKTGIEQGLYGGSVKPENIAEYMGKPAIDGVLVGGASADSSSFLQLLHAIVRQ